MIGPGKYDKQLMDALRSAGASQGFLIILDGSGGPGFAAQMTLENEKKIPQVLRIIAAEIEADFSTMKEQEE